MTTATTIKQISIDSAKLPRLGEYAAWVINMGHVPGVLSGSELKGAAKKFGSKYATQRTKAEDAVKPFGIVSAIVHDEARGVGVRVWVEQATGERVELTIV